ncbi:Retrotransposable element Tf2 [Gossypium australe]|uniref:Retrotransposable element Tf2 n=1 Tax=Gossypium australe TaxID=47621 RepID=A0A5B6W822_9ROSI|nr:Retrotransposable element Tf2 [Gossypium australe]
MVDKKRYFNPYPVEARVGQVAYKLILPPIAHIRSTFHVSPTEEAHWIKGEFICAPSSRV